MFSEQQIKGKWKEFKGGIRNLWGQISDDELERTKGSLGKISGLVQAKYGETRESVSKKLDRLLQSFDNETDKHPGEVGETSYGRSPLEGRKVYDSREIFEDDRSSIGH